MGKCFIIKLMKKPKIYYGWVIVAASFFAEIMAFGAMYTFSVFFGPLCEEFGWTRAMTAGAFSTYMIVHGVFYIVSGMLTDKYGPRIVVVIGGLLMGLGLCLTSQVNTIGQLYLFLGVIVGIGMGSVFVPLATTTTRWFEDKRGLALGIVTAGSPVGTIVLSLVAQYLILNYDWRTAYIIIGIATLTIVIIAALFLRRDPGEIGLLPLGAKAKSNGDDLADNRVENGYSLAEAIKTKIFWIIGAVNLMYVAAVFVPMTHIVVHCLDIGIEPMAAAGMVAFIGGGQIAGRLGGGVISDRIGSRNTLILSFSFLTGCLFWVIWINEGWMFMLFSLIFGLSFGVAVPQIPRLVVDFFGLKQMGVILGVITALTAIGGALGSWLGGYIFDMTGSYSSAFMIGGILTLVSLVVVALFLKVPK